MTTSSLNKVKIKQSIRDAILSFYENENHLINVNANERSVTHQIALYLSRQNTFRGFDVDCEYNRNIDITKRLDLKDPDDVSTAVLVSKTVYPDIIIHKRGNNDSNLVVLEAKRAGEDIGFDLNKLRAYQSMLKYKLAVMIIIPCTQQGKFTIRWDDDNFSNEETLNN